MEQPRNNASAAEPRPRAPGGAALWIAVAIAAFGLLQETHGLFWREWRWLWAVLAAAALFAGTLRSAAARGPVFRPWALALCGLELLTGILAIRSWSGAVDLLPTALFGATFLLGTVATMPKKGQALVVVLAAATFVFAFGLADYFNVAQPWRAKNDTIVAGIFGQRNTLMMFGALLLGPLVWCARRAESLPLRIWSAVLALVAAALPFTEQSLTAWIALAVGAGCAACAVVLAARRIKPPVKAALVGAVVLAGALLLASDAAGRMFREKASSFLSRTEIYTAARNAGMESVPWGEGLGGFARVSSVLRPNDTLSGIPHTGSVASGAHNHWLQAWAERGVPGTAVAGLFTLLALLGVANALRKKEPLFSVLLCVTALMALVHASFDLSTHAFPTTCALFGLLCGVAAAQLPCSWQEKWDALLSRKIPPVRMQQIVCAGLALLALYGLFLAQRRVRSEEAAKEATYAMAVAPGSSVKGVAQALEIDEKNPLPRWLLVGFLRSNGLLDDAAAHLDYLEKISGDRFPIAGERAEIAAARKEWDAVLGQSGKALKINALWNNRMWTLRALALAHLERCDEFARVKRDGRRWSWNPDDPSSAPVRILVQQPELRDRPPLVRDLQTLEMLSCPYEDPVALDVAQTEAELAERAAREKERTTADPLPEFQPGDADKAPLLGKR
ncbi:MAG: O-antigen ligase family protein [Fibrobacterales bacterium]|nr:O-antigen ligase family protein [Fibrobacterales bacterium]